MGVGQVISDTFGMVKGRFGPLLGLWAVYIAITMVLFMVMGIGVGVAGIAGFAALGESNPMAAGGGMIVLVVLIYVGYLLVAMAQYGSMISMASPLNRLSFGEALGTGWRAAPALLLVMVVLLIGYFAAAMLLGVVGAAFSAIGEWGAALFAVLLVPVLVWLGCRLSALFGVVAVDGVRNPFAAIARSWRLTAGHALTIFLATLVFVVILLVICGLALLPSIGLLRGMADPSQMADVGPALGGIGLMFLGFLIVSVVFNLAYCAFLAVIHGTLTSAAGEGVTETFA
jgi:hypothetical protein